MNPFIFNSQVTQLFIATSVSLVIYYNGIRRRHRLTRSGILQPGRSPWRHLYENGDEASFLNLTGFSRAAFHQLHEYMYRDNELPRTGRPRLLNTEDELGIILFYLGSSMTISHLCLIFGCTPSRCSDIINNQLLSLSRRLKNHPKARIHWPSTLREKEYLADLVHRREPNVLDVIGFTDGLSLPIQCASDPISQATNYNGYHHDTMINNVFCFSPTGKIIFACINFPGSWHDSQVSLSLISKVVRNIGDFKICVDQGFPRSGDLLNKFVGPLSRRARSNLPVETRRAALRRHNTYVSLRQSSEWGMRALQGTFVRMKSRLTSNKRKRRQILTVIILLHNFRTDVVGLNQIATVFNVEYESYVNIRNYDRIAQYYENVEDSDED
jgi:hypothetical protein